MQDIRIVVYFRFYIYRLFSIVTTIELCTELIKLYGMSSRQELFCGTANKTLVETRGLASKYITPLTVFKISDSLMEIIVLTNCGRKCLLIVVELSIPSFKIE